MALPAHAERVIREVIQRLAASRRTFRSHQIERAREQLETLLAPDPDTRGEPIMRTAENLRENIALTIRTLEALHTDARARAEGAKKDAPSVGLARALDQARSILAAALQAAAPKKEKDYGEEKQ
jgi:hypothetical protein